MTITKKIIISSLFWKLIERIGTQGIQFILQIILARLLSPDQFGTIAIVMVFINLANVFIQSGFNMALIQKKDIDNGDFSSVLYVNLIVSSLLYLIIFLFAPIIAEFYRDTILLPVLRILGLTLFFGSVNSIQNAYVARNMLFRKLFYSSLGSIIVSGVIGIVLAFSGVGVWALVFQQLTNQILITMIMWFTVRWRPTRELSKNKIKILFIYGWKLVTSSLLNTLYMELRTLIIGRVYSPSLLGYYNRGQQLPQLICTNIDGAIQSVMLPTLSAYQDNKIKVKNMMRRAVVTSSFLVFPMMIGMASVAEPLIRIILTDKWLPAVPFLQIFCISFMLTPIHTANLQAINAMGRSDIFLRLEIIKKVIGFIILVFSLPFGVYAIAIGQLAGGFISTFINAYPNKKLLDYSYTEQWMDIMPTLIIAVLMGAGVQLLNFLNLVMWQIFVIQIVFGITFYIGIAKMFKLECFSYLVTTLKQLINSRKVETI